MGELPYESQVCYCPHCLHATVFANGGFNDFTPEQINNPKHTEAFKEIQDLQQKLAHERGLWG
jgi:hypothetical protein